MRSMTVFACAVFSLAIISPIVAGEGAETGSGYSFAWVDLQKVMKAYYKTDAMLEKFEKEKAAKEDEIKGMVGEIEKMEGELLLLTKAAREAKEDEILKRKVAVNTKIEEAEKELSAQSISKQGELVEDVMAVAEMLARKEGYTFIFRAEGLLYKDPALDLTDRVIGELNKGHEKEARKVEDE